MRHPALLLPLALAGALAGGCAARARLPEPTALHASHVPGVSVAQLSEGRRVYVARCGGCHNLYSPDRYGEAAWERAVDKMAPKAKLTARQREDVLAYLLAVVRTPPEPQPTAPGGTPASAR